MKKISLAVLLVVVLMALLVVPVFALQTEPPVTAEQIVLLGAVASALTFIFNALLTYGKVHVTRFWANIVLFLVSTGLAWVWSNVVFPPLPSDPGEWWNFINAVLMNIMPILGMATFIYNILYSKVIVPLTLKYLPKLLAPY